MKSRTMVILVVVIVICIAILWNFVFSMYPFGTEHCPGLEMRKSLGLVDPNARCL